MNVLTASIVSLQNYTWTTQDTQLTHKAAKGRKLQYFRQFQGKQTENSRTILYWSFTKRTPQSSLPLSLCKIRELFNKTSPTCWKSISLTCHIKALFTKLWGACWQMNMMDNGVVSKLLRPPWDSSELRIMLAHTGLWNGPAFIIHARTSSSRVSGVIQGFACKTQHDFIYLT